MDNTPADEIKAKAEVIRQFINREAIEKLNKYSSPILARHLDGELARAGFDSQYLNNLSQVKHKDLRNSSVPTTIAEFMRKEGMPSDVVGQIEKIWNSHIDVLIKESKVKLQSIENNQKPHHIEIDNKPKITNFTGLSKGLKYAAISIAPPGIDIAFFYDATEQVLTKAEADLNKHRLTPEQFQVLSKVTENTFTLAVGSSIIPDPSGLTSDAAVCYGNKRAMAALIAAGVPSAQVENYQIGSFIQIMENTADAVSKAQSNKNDIEQLKSAYNEIPLSVALDYSPSQLASFGKMSETLDRNALRLEVMRHPDFEKLTHLSNEDLSLLSKLVNAGIDPDVRVNDAHEIVISPQQVINDYENSVAQNLVATDIQNREKLQHEDDVNSIKKPVKENKMADNNEPSFGEMTKALSSGAVDVISENATQFANVVKTVINDPKIINEIIAQEIRTQHCKDLKDKLDNGGKPITQHQIDQCIAFATGDMEELQRLTNLSTSNTR